MAAIRPGDLALPDAHASSARACLATLDSRPEGLSTAEAERRLAEHGPNRLPQARSRGPLMRLLAQFHNVLIYALLASAAITVVSSALNAARNSRSASSPASRSPAKLVSRA